MPDPFHSLSQLIWSVSLLATASGIGMRLAATVQQLADNLLNLEKTLLRLPETTTFVVGVVAAVVSGTPLGFGSSGSSFLA